MRSLSFFIAFLLFGLLAAQNSEADYYPLASIPVKEGLVLEVGGVAFLPDDQLAVSTRRGEVWVIDGWQGNEPSYKLFARGLHEPLGLSWHDGALYLAQRTEITRLRDRNQDGRADCYETVYSWPLTANYHEYAYGPLFLPNGDMIITLNVGWEGGGVSRSPFRGWLLKVSPDGEMTPLAAGLRSPAGFGFNAEGDVFYAENQGDWVGSGRMTHLEAGDFAGHPASLAWTADIRSPLDLRVEDVTDEFGTMYEAGKQVPSLKLPAVWFPHSIMGISTSDILAIPDDRVGPFAGQLLVGDQGQSKVMRVYLEKVGGEYQGACFPFREGFHSGILRLAWAPDKSLIAGMTSRGWNATGKDQFGLDRVTYSGEVPFEVQSVQAQPDGFLLTFTKKVDPQSARDTSSYRLQNFTYQYHHRYGSPSLDISECPVEAIELGADGQSVRLKVKNLKLGYVHEIRTEGIRSADGNQAILHPLAYYTLNALPEGGDPAYMGTPKDLTESPILNTRKHLTEIPQEWNGRIDQEVRIQTEPGLKYDTQSFSVKGGAQIALTLVNPDDMQHNLVIARPGFGQKIGTMAMQLGLKGPGQHYIPDTWQLLCHTRLLEPDTEETIYFKVPNKPGVYEFICTVPGHATVMQGTMVVK